MENLIKEVKIKNNKYSVYGVSDSETPVGEYDFYDVYDKSGECINEGCPFDEEPTKKDIENFLKENK